VINKLRNLTEQERANGVVTASAGNHGQAVAFGARELGFLAKVVVPIDTPKVKVEGIKGYGAELLLFGKTYPEAEDKAKQLAQEEGRLYISPYNDSLIVAGHGTAGLEILQDLPELDVIVVPVGGGGLISGISIAVKRLKPSAEVIGVQSRAVPIMYDSLKAGRIIPPHRHEPATIAEGLSGGIEQGSITFAIAQQYVNRVMLVKEESIRQAVYLLCKNEGQVVEGSGVVGVTMLLENRELFSDKTVVVEITGGNIDTPLLASIIAEQAVAQPSL